VNPAALLFLPMLGKHPDEYPRFRDCFASDEEHLEYDNHIIVYTRTGGGNRDDYIEENDKIRSMDGFVVDYDDSFDCTFASWVFEVPKKWKSDYDALMKEKIQDVSEQYRDQMLKIYPKLKEKIDELFLVKPKTVDGI